MMRSVTLLASLAAAALAQTPPAAEIVELLVAAVDEQGTFQVEGQPELVGVGRPLLPDAPIALSCEPRGTGGAVLSVPSCGVSITIAGAAAEVLLDAQDRIVIRPAATPAGTIDVLVAAGGRVRFAFGDAVIEMTSGAARLSASAEGWRFTLAAGKAEAGGTSLDAAGSNTLTSSGGSLGAAQKSESPAAALLATRSKIVQRAMLPLFARMAEAVAEGDIEPPARGSATVAVTVAPEVKVGEIVPRGGTVAGQAGTTAVAAAGGARGASTAEQFIRSGSATLIIIGTRIERTRIIGAGIGGNTALQVSPRLSRPRVQIGGR
jgi:hypothetical protein